MLGLFVSFNQHYVRVLSMDIFQNNHETDVQSNESSCYLNGQSQPCKLSIGISFLCRFLELIFRPS